MKKLFVVVLAVIMLFGISANTLAASTPKSVEVKISDPANVQTGQVVTLTAVTLKHGSEYKDEWIGATEVSTVLTEDGYYISTAQVVANESVTVQYNITMSAGKNVYFAGNAFTSVNVDEQISVVGAEVRNISPLSWMAGFYIGDTFALLSNGTAVQTGCTIFGMSPDQTSRELNISFLIFDAQYNFVADVSI